MAIEWDTDREAHLARHHVTIAQANEALTDPNRVVINPDYASISGRGIRTIGYSASFGGLLSVMTWIDQHGVERGTTAFRAKTSS